MLNHLKRLLIIDTRYKWLIINLIIGSFFILAPYCWLVPQEQQALTLKGMLCWYGLNQAFFAIGGFVEEERMEGTFTNLFLLPIDFKEYFIAKGFQTLVETYSISVLNIIAFSLLGVRITNVYYFLIVLFINDIVAINMSILFLCLSMQFKKLGSINALCQQIIGFFSGYSVDIKRYPYLIQAASYIIPLTYTIKFAREDMFSTNILILLIVFVASFILAIIGFTKINNSIQVLRYKGDTEQW